MLDNLALGGSSEINLTTSDTNITTNWTLPASVSVSEYSSSYTNARLITELVNTVSPDSMSTAGGWKVGGYYNYCAASAGTYCYSSTAATNTPITSDICPRGWRLPSGGVGGEYQIAFLEYNDYRLFRTVLHLPVSGYPYNNGSVSYLGERGYNWTRTFYGADSQMYDAHVTAAGGGDMENNNTHRDLSISIRCMSTQ